jgi:hypothetical protein
MSVGCQKEGWKKAACVVIYTEYTADDPISRNDFRVFAKILVRVNCDGKIGFFGKCIDIDADNFNIVDAVNQELPEDCKLYLSKSEVKRKIIPDEVEKLETHFYALQVPKDDFQKIAKSANMSNDSGCEVEVCASCQQAVNVRCIALGTRNGNVEQQPFYHMKSQFIGKSWDQLMDVLEEFEIMPTKEVSKIRKRNK